MSITPEELSELSQVPGMTPPPGKTSHLDDPTYDGTLRPEVIALGAIFAAITVLCCALRVYTRMVVLKCAGWDDIWAVVATICACAYTGLVLASASVLVDVHQWDISAEKLIHYLPLLRAIGYFYFIPTLFAAKVALASFFLRIWSSKRWLRVSIWLTIAWAAFVSLFALFWSIGRCSPLGLAYLKCSAKSSLPYVVAAGMNIATDVALLIIPLLGVFSLQMQTQKKLSLSLIFLTGVTAVVASALGLYYRIVQLNSPDTTWNFAPVNILSMFEIDTTVIVACLPALPALFNRQSSFVEQVGNTYHSIKQALLASTSRLSRGGARSSKSSSTEEDMELRNKITVQSDIYQIEEGKRQSDDTEHCLVAPFARHEPPPGYNLDPASAHTRAQR